MNGNRSIVYREFVGVIPVAKTLRNELRPVGHTQEHIIQNGLIQEDELRQEKSTELKNIMDDYYREYIDKSLSGVTDLDFTLLFELMNLVQSSPSKDNKKALEKEQSKMREQICTHLQSDSNYKNIFNAKLLKEILPDFIKNYNQYDVKDKAGKLETLALFNGFSTYFTDFFEKRKNVFTKEAVSTSIAYRIVHENSLIFLANMTSYKKISEKALDEIEVIEKREIKNFIKEKLVNILREMGYQAEVEIQVKQDIPTYRIYSNNDSLLIGKGGKNLEALQIVLRQIVNTETGINYKFFLDVSDYKEKNEHHLEILARRLAREVATTKIEVKMDSMNSYERRIVHNVLTNNKKVYTESVGEEPNRCVVIKPRED